MMRKSQTKTTQRVGRRLHVAAMRLVLVLGVGLGVAGSATAGNVLFSLKTSSCGNPSPPVCWGQSSHAHSHGRGPNARHDAEHDGRSRLHRSHEDLFHDDCFYVGISLRCTPILKSRGLGYNKAGSLMAGAWTPSVVKTFMDPDTQYPFITATPAVGRIIANVGSQGIAGPLPFAQQSVYEFTVNYGGIQQNTAQVAFTVGGPLSNNRSQGWRRLRLPRHEHDEHGRRRLGRAEYLGVYGYGGDRAAGPVLRRVLYGHRDGRSNCGGGRTDPKSSLRPSTTNTSSPPRVPGDGTGTITGLEATRLARGFRSSFSCPCQSPVRSRCSVWASSDSRASG